MVTRRLTLLASLLAACGGGHPGGGDGGTDGGSCPNLSPTCPSPPPSYATQVAPILERSCLPCHTPGKQPYAAPTDLTNWSAVNGIHGTVLDELFVCAMPNGDGGPGFVLDGGAPTISDADKLTVMDWCLCEAPNN
ncbi:MAG TPA: hypothetical protein VMB50_09880 [Myxococcales bacterium]|nr:hypothetical protein [Myxococcales bacterium]